MINTPEAIEAADAEFERMDALLIDGTMAQLRELESWRCPRCGKPMGFRYSQSCGSFSYGCGCTLTRSCKMFERPACAELFGDEYGDIPMERF